MKRNLNKKRDRTFIQSIIWADHMYNTTPYIFSGNTFSLPAASLLYLMHVTTYLCNAEQHKQHNNNIKMTQAAVPAVDL